MRDEHDSDGGPILSSFRDDPEMTELIDYFVKALPERIAALEEAWQAADVASLKRIAHQLKGSAVGFGFEAIGQAACELEAPLAEAPVGEDVVSGIEAQFRRLVDLCSRAAMDAS